MEIRPEGRSEQEAMREPLRGLATALKVSAIKGISVEVLVHNLMPPSRAREIFDYLERNGAIDQEEGSADEGYAVNKEVLEKLIEGGPGAPEKEKASDVPEAIREARKEVEQEIKDGQATAEHAGAVDPTSQKSLRDAESRLGKTIEQEATILAAKEAFEQGSAMILEKNLLAGIEFSPEFEPELRDTLFERGPEKIRELLKNLRRCILKTPADLSEFTVEIFQGGRVAFSSERKSLEIGITALRTDDFPITAEKLEHESRKILETQEALREQKRLDREKESFIQEQTAFETRVGSFSFLPRVEPGTIPIIQQDIIEKGRSKKFFTSLETALNLGNDDVAQRLKSLQIFVSGSDEVLPTPQSITIGIGALGKGVIKETARKIREKIAPAAATAPKPEAPRVKAPAPNPVAPQEKPASQPSSPAEEPKAVQEVAQISEGPAVEELRKEERQRAETEVPPSAAEKESWLARKRSIAMKLHEMEREAGTAFIKSRGGPEKALAIRKLRTDIARSQSEEEVTSMLNDAMVGETLTESQYQTLRQIIEAASVPPPETPPVTPPQPETPPKEEKTSGEKLADLLLKWKTVFQIVGSANEVWTWAESQGERGMENLIQNLDELFTLISADSELLPHLLKYRVFVHGHEGNLTEKGNISISAPDLVKNGIPATAEILVAEVRALEGLAPKVSGKEAAPAARPETPPVTPPKMEKTPAQKLADLLSRWEEEKPLSKLVFLRNIAAAPQEQWPNFLGQAAGMVYFGSRLSTHEFQEISGIIGEGVTIEQLAEQNRSAAAAISPEFETAHRADKEYRDPVRAFMRVVMRLSEDEIKEIDFQYKVIVGQEPAKDGNPLGGSGITVTCSNYHDFLRERQKISPEERTHLDTLWWDEEPSQYNKLNFLATDIFDRLNKGGDLAQHGNAFRSLLFGIVRGEFAPDDFAAWAKAGEDKIPAGATERPEAKKESIAETVDRLNAIYTEFDLSVPDMSDAEREDNASILNKIEFEIYPTILPLMNPLMHAARIGLLLSYQNVFSYDGGGGRRTSANGSTGIEIDKRDTNENIIAHIREFLEHNPQFAVDGAVPEGERARTEVAEEGKHEEEEQMSLDEARDAYATAYAEYVQRNSAQGYQTLGIGGKTRDLQAVEGARARYDAALKVAAREMRAEERARVLVPESVWTEEEATNSANEIIFNELVIAEEKRLSDLRVGEWLPKEQGLWKRGWLAYARLPRRQKLAASAAFGAVVAGATGGAMAALYYGGRKLASIGASSAAGASTAPLFGAYDRTLGKKNTKEYKLDKFLSKQRDDISENLDAMRLEYKTILAQNADRERKRMYLKAGIAALAGAGVAWEVHHLTSVTPPHGAGAPSSAPKTVMPQRIGPSDRPSPLDDPTRHAPTPSPAETPAPDQTTPQTEMPPGSRPVVPEQPTTPPVIHPPTESASDVTPPRILRPFTPPAARLNTPQPVELQEPPEMLSNPIVVPQETPDIITNLAGRPSGPGFIETHPPTPLDNTVGPDTSHAFPNSQPLPRPGEPLLSGAQPDNYSTAETLRKLKAMRDEMTANPVPPPPLVPDLHQAPVFPVPVRPPESIITAPAEAPHEIIGSTAVPRPELGNVPTPEAVQNSINAWDGKDIAQAAKIAHQVEDVSRLSEGDRSLLVSSLAQKVGDKNWSANFDHLDAEAVSSKIKDYLVAYPEAERLGFHNYAEYAGIKNVTVSRLIDQIPPSDSLRNALRHSFLHRGAHIAELRNGVVHNVPLRVEHAQLGLTLRIVAKAGDLQKTVGQLLAENVEGVEQQAPNVLRLMRETLSRR